MRMSRPVTLLASALALSASSGAALAVRPACRLLTPALAVAYNPAVVAEPQYSSRATCAYVSPDEGTPTVAISLIRSASAAAARETYALLRRENANDFPIVDLTIRGAHDAFGVPVDNDTFLNMQVYFRRGRFVVLVQIQASVASGDADLDDVAQLARTIIKRWS